MNAPLRLALIGCGSIAQRGILPHLALDDARQTMTLAAVCDVVAERARATADRFGVPAWYSSMDALLAEADIDAVLIATPIPFHFENAMAAIDAGKHVYLQKTMTTNLAEANQLSTATAEKKGLKVVASPGQMLSPAYRQLRRAIQDGIIGRPYWAFASTAFAGHEYESFRAGEGGAVDPTWYYKPGGGPVYDMGVYTLHALTGLLGPARQISAMSNIGLPYRSWPGADRVAVEMDDNTLFLLSFESCLAVVGSHFCQTGRIIGWGFTGIYGSSGTLEITGLADSTGYPAEIEFVRAQAVASFDGGSYKAEGLDSLPASITPEHAAIEEAHVYADIHHFAQCILEDRPPVADAAHARHVIEIIEKGYLAAQSGQTQTLETTFKLISLE